MLLSVPVERIQKRDRCCGCLHVRTGTVLLAVSQILIHFVVLALLAFIGHASLLKRDVEYLALSMSVMSFIQWERFVSESYRIIGKQDPVVSPQILQPSVTNTVGIEGMHLIIPADNPISATTKSLVPEEITQAQKTYLQSNKFFVGAGEEFVSIAITLFSLLFSLMMLVGTIYVKPCYLIPYCFLQFFDLFVTCLSVVGCYTYLPSRDTWVKSKVLLTLVVIIAGMLLLAIKAYVLVMVWSCYKFLVRYTNRMENVTGFAFSANSCICSDTCLRCMPFITRSERSPPDWNAPVGSTVIERRRNLRSNNLFVFFGDGASTTSAFPGNSAGPTLPDDDVNILPKYEDAVAMPANAYAPPTYAQTVQASQPEALQLTSTAEELPPTEEDPVSA